MRISDWSSDVCSSDLVAEALEPRLVRHVRGMCRHNELHRPRPISVQLRHERGRDTLELPDEDLLHLRMKVRLRLLYADEVDTGRCRCRRILPEEAQKRKSVGEGRRGLVR